LFVSQDVVGLACVVSSSFIPVVLSDECYESVWEEGIDLVSSSSLYKVILKFELSEELSISGCCKANKQS
jgi:hypothetical protein